MTNLDDRTYECLLMFIVTKYQLRKILYVFKEKL